MSELTIRFPYQDSQLPIEQRVEDLLSRMELEDKAGLMFQQMVGIGGFDDPGILGSPPMRKLLDRRVNHVNILTAPSAREIAEWHNAVQREALSTPLGIPVSLSSDPRHAFSDNPAAALIAGPFSQWPEFLGFGALDDIDLTQKFGEIVRREYVAVGIRAALHPQIDLATEPRWARASGTFGESAEVAGRLGVAYLQGLRGDQIGAESVSTMAKHFPGGGPQMDGEDAHFDYGREQVYPGGQFDLHLQPFRELIDAGVTQLMPYYGMPVGTEYEEVGFSFNKQIITHLLREQLGFDGIVCSDWGILSRTFWGVESLTYSERMLKALDAGIDQFGGEHRPAVLIELLQAGKVDESRIDVSVRRLLREKFALGLFDNRFVDVEAAEKIVGSPDAVAAGLEAQAASFVLLQNENGAAHLPVAGQPSVYLEGADAQAFAGWANIVLTPEEADIAIVRTSAPWEPRGNPGELDSFFHAGSLDFHDDELHHLRTIAAAVPLILDVQLDRPAIVAPLLDIASTITANFGASGEALARIVFGAAEPKGRLPFDIPSSMTAVENSRPDVPFDTADPTFRFGYGLTFENWVAAERPDLSTTVTASAVPTQRFDLEASPLAAIIADPEAKAILDELLPGLTEHPMISAAKALPFSMIISMAAAETPETVIDELNARVSALPPISSE